MRGVAIGGRGRRQAERNRSSRRGIKSFAEQAEIRTTSPGPRPVIKERCRGLIKERCRGRANQKYRVRIRTRGNPSVEYRDYMMSVGED